MTDLFKNKDKLKKNLSGLDDFLSNDSIDIPVIEISLDELHEFQGHPFHVVDEDLADLIESIKENGVLEPGIVRPRKKGGYEVVSGHRRKRACELAGLEKMPVRVMNYSDDEATIIMVDSNLHREVILPSEKAKSYAMKAEVLKKQKKTWAGNTLSDLAEQSGEGAKTIQRYIWLSRLNDDLLGRIDEGVIPVTVGVELSFLSPESQKIVYDEFEFLYESKIITKISGDSAEMLRKMEQNQPLTEHDVLNVLQSVKLPTKPKPFKFKNNRMREYFKPDTDPEKIEDTIYELLEIWKSHKGNALFKDLREDDTIAQLPGQLSLNDLEK